MENIKRIRIDNLNRLAAQEKYSTKTALSKALGLTPGWLDVDRTRQLALTTSAVSDVMQTIKDIQREMKLPDLDTARFKILLELALEQNGRPAYVRQLLRLTVAP